jgi:hypothetical protein
MHHMRAIGSQGGFMCTAGRPNDTFLCPGSFLTDLEEDYKKLSLFMSSSVSLLSISDYAHIYTRSLAEFPP